MSNPTGKGEMERAARARARGLTRSALMLGGVCFVMIWAAANAVVWETRRVVIAQAEHDLTMQRSLLVEQVGELIQSLDLGIRLLDEQRRSGRLTMGGSDGERLASHVALRDLQKHVFRANALALFDAAGQLRISSRDWPTPQTSIAGMPLFAALQKTPDTGPLIGTPIEDAPGHWRFDLYRALVDEQGNFVGVGAVTVDVDRLAKLYAGLDLGPGDAVGLVRDDLTLLLRQPAEGYMPGMRVPGASAGPQLDANGIVRRIPQIGPREARFLTVQQVPGAPVYVTLVRLESEVLASWRQLARFVGFIGALTMLGIFVLTLLLVRRSREMARSTEALATARDRAQQASHAKSEFLAHMSHELRTPLNAVLGFADLIRNRLLPERAPEYADSIHHAGAHLLMLVDDLLDLNRIESGLYKLTPTKLLPGAALDEAMALLAPLAARRGVELVRGATSSQHRVCADATALHQCLLNLLGNAIKFTAQGKRVEATISDGEHSVRFAIADEGVGIDEVELAQIFEPFRRGSVRVAKDEQGAGLGLAITKRLADLQDGSLRLTSRVGHGTTALLELPRAEA